MKQVFKYPIPLAEAFAIDMPEGAALLHFDAQDGVPTLWALVNAVAPKETRHFCLVGTGQPFDGRGLAFVGTVLLREGSLVFHLFEHHQEPSQRD